MSRNTLVVLGALATTLTAGAATPQRPNIVFILADDMGWSDTSVLGAKLHPTPAIERLAREGVTFTNFHMCQNCAPSRACLMTGLYPPRTGIYTVGTLARGNAAKRAMKVPENTEDLATDIPTIANRLHAAGYDTAMFGKWHLGYDAKHHPSARGFDRAILTKNGPHFGFATSPKQNVPRDAYMADWLTDRAVEYIGEHKPGKPFFLYVPHTAVHTPIQAPDSYVERAKSLGDKNVADNPKYAGIVSAVDRSVERIMKAIDERGLKENTILIFTSDNGGVGGYGPQASNITDNAPLRGGKGQHYEGGLRVPFIVRGARVGAAGVTVDTPVVHVDLPATLAEIAGPAAQTGPAFDGESLLPWIEHPGEKRAHAPIFGHLPGYLEGHGGGGWRTTPVSHVIRDNWKLMVFHEDNRLELYDLNADPGEKNNLARTRPEIAKELESLLRRWLSDTKAAMPVKK